MLKQFILLLAVGLASAFMPHHGQILTQRTQPMQMGYIPDGLTEKEWAAKQKKEAAKLKASKTKKRGMKETLTDWKKRNDKLNPNSPGSGHEFVKLKGKGKQLGGGTY
mmetsp:Transcript_24635/g.33774  ORF Transcript_24635/g.33774 Transcript_24635/m.33774 type:complete len:108 (-) Transcript_24635:351-674(-)